MENVRNDQEEMLEIRNTVTEMENTSQRLMGGLDAAEASLCELGDKTGETSQSETQRENLMKKTERSATVAQLPKCETFM